MCAKLFNNVFDYLWFIRTERNQFEIESGHELKRLPLLSVEIDGNFILVNQQVEKLHNLQVKMDHYPLKPLQEGYLLTFQFTNTGKDTIDIANVVPFGENKNHFYITSKGPWALARAKLFRPNHGPEI